MPDWIIWLAIVLALGFGFTNGWNDAANSIETVVSTRVLTPPRAILLAGTLNVAGAFYSRAVAETIGGELVDPAQVNQMVILATLVAVVIWNTIMTLAGLPISASHALIGGLIGGAAAGGGWAILNLPGVRTLLLAWLISPVFAALLGWFIMQIIHLLFRNRAPAATNTWFRRLQLASIACVSFAHGSGGAQKVMGIITLALLVGGYTQTLSVPYWVTISAGVSLGLGTVVGGWGMIKSRGMKLLQLQPVHGFAAETAAATLLLIAARVGLPLSSTHIITGSVIGVGRTKPSRTRWGLTSKVTLAWLLTLPGCGTLAWLIYKGLEKYSPIH